MKKFFIAITVLFLLTAVGCSEPGEIIKTPTDSPATAKPTASPEPDVDPTEAPEQRAQPASYDPNDPYLWFCPSVVSPQFDSPAKVLNIATGEVLVACPDPLCTHGEWSETCFFNVTEDETNVYATEYLNGHIYFAADKKTDDGRSMKLYDYDLSSGRTDAVYTFSFVETNVRLYKNSNTLFFTAVTEGDEYDNETWTIGLFSYDPETKAIALLESNARYAMGGGVVFFDDYYIREDGYTVDGENESYWFCRCSYDGTVLDRFDSLPDGTPFSPIGWGLKPSGVFANTWGNGGTYLIEDGVKLDFPTDSATTAPVRYKDDYYFQTRGSNYVKIGTDPYTGAEHRSYEYDNELYVMNKDGSYKHYSIDCEYHFITAAAYGNEIIGLIIYKIPAPGQCMMGGDSDTYFLPDIIRIDLETGETTVYDMSMRNGFVKETFVCAVTLNEE